jgi:hypothetical protein
MAGTSNVPVFYDVEASSLDGFPIEIGWARADPASATILSEGHLIRPPTAWDVRGTWDSFVASRHGIVLDELWRAGRPVLEIARRMNETLRSSELFADSPFDEPRLQQFFDAAGIDAEFSLLRTHPAVLIADFTGDGAAYTKAKRRALRIAPPKHRAEAAARHWAVLWAMVAGVPVETQNGAFGV